MKGLYLLCEVGGQVLYVGMSTTSIEGRITAHESGRGIDAKFVDYLAGAQWFYTELANDAMIRGAEKLLIAKYRPALNVVDAQSGDADLGVNLSLPTWKPYVPELFTLKNRVTALEAKEASLRDKVIELEKLTKPKPVRHHHHHQYPTIKTGDLANITVHFMFAEKQASDLNVGEAELKFLAERRCRVSVPSRTCKLITYKAEVDEHVARLRKRADAATCVDNYMLYHAVSYAKATFDDEKYRRLSGVFFESNTHRIDYTNGVSVYDDVAIWEREGDMAHVTKLAREIPFRTNQKFFKVIPELAGKDLLQALNERLVACPPSQTYVEAMNFNYV